MAALSDRTRIETQADRICKTTLLFGQFYLWQQSLFTIKVGPAAHKVVYLRQ